MLKKLLHSTGGLIFLAVLLLIFILLILNCFIPLPITVHKTMTGTSWISGDDDYAQPVDITFDGVYRFYLFKDDQYRGKIWLTGDGCDFSAENCFVSLMASTYHGGSVVYYDADTNTMDYYGALYIKGVFREVYFWVGADDTIRKPVSFPSGSRDEAVSMAQKYFGQQFGFN